MKKNIFISLYFFIIANNQSGLNKYGSAAEKTEFNGWLRYSHTDVHTPPPLTHTHILYLNKFVINIRCYGKSHSEKDGKGRTLWYFTDQEERPLEPADRSLLASPLYSQVLQRAFPNNIITSNQSLSFGASSSEANLAMTHGLLSSTAQLLPLPPLNHFNRPDARTATVTTTPIRRVDEPKAAGRSVTTKLLLLIALLWKSGKISEEQKGVLKEILILGSPPSRRANDGHDADGDDDDRCHGWVAKLEACLEFFEASENDVDELAHTFARICRLYTLASGHRTHW